MVDDAASALQHFHDLGDAAEAPEHRTPFVVARVGNADLALAVPPVKEVLRTPEITRIPLPPPAVRGLASVRGVIVPVLDLGERLFETPTEPPGALIIIDLESVGGPLGLLVDTVIHFTQVPDADIEPAPPEAEAGLPTGWIRGIFAADERVVTILDLEAVLERTPEPGRDDDNTPPQEQR